ncbi:SprB repeat-containing protein [Flavobacterium oreochromis]|uniref:SprB repeat-containing protein n=1 Tax=Flavobacterium oreochromis TaxID=2906078 RepID=UPI001CE546BA|nr:SprB repeat-containing protein [Flavobacterium oreochromis]QYS85492.1 SprB repeat-containing protein [Flavobacterium oreochromis]
MKGEGPTLKVFTNTNKLIYDARTKEYELLEVSINDFPLRFESRHYVKGFYSNFNKNLRIGPDDCLRNDKTLMSYEDYISKKNRLLVGCDAGILIIPFILDSKQSVIGSCETLSIEGKMITSYFYLDNELNWKPFPKEYLTFFDDEITRLNFKPEKIFGNSFSGNIKIKGLIRKEELLALPKGTQFILYNNGVPKNVDEFETNIVINDIFLCSIQIVDIKGNAVKCAGGSDGSIKFKFDRDLGSADEKLNLILKNSKGGVLGTRSVSASEFNNKNQEYIWEGIPSDTYILNYQVITNTSSRLPLESNPIIVGTPEALSFTTTAIQPVSCYEGNNGQFMLTPGGGTGKYNYTISNVISNQVIATGEIARGTSTTLTGLKKRGI